jgi:hypothetical protein
MSISRVIFDLLKGLVGDRVYPDLALENTVRPFIVYQKVGGRAVNFVEATVPSKRNGRFQISVWSETRLEADAIALQAETILRQAAALQTTVLTDPFSAYDELTKSRGTQQDFSFWFDRNL